MLQRRSIDFLALDPKLFILLAGLMLDNPDQDQVCFLTQNRPQHAVTLAPDLPSCTDIILLARHLQQELRMAMLPFVPLGSRAHAISEAAERLRDALLTLLENDEVLTADEPLDNPRVPYSKAQKKRAMEKAKKKKKKRIAELDGWRQRFESLSLEDEEVKEERVDEPRQTNRARQAVKSVPSGEKGGCRLS